MDRSSDLDFLKPMKVVADDDHQKLKPLFVADKSDKDKFNDKIEANAIDFLNAVDTLPGIEDFLFLNNEDGSDRRNSRQIRRLVSIFEKSKITFSSYLRLFSETWSPSILLPK